MVVWKLYVFVILPLSQIGGEMEDKLDSFAQSRQSGQHRLLWAVASFILAVKCTWSYMKTLAMTKVIVGRFGNFITCYLH